MSISPEDTDCANLQQFSIPKHLESTEASLFCAIQAEYDIRDAGGVALLTAACESAQRVRQAREHVAKTGLVNKYGKPNPLLSVERDARRAFIAAIKELGVTRASTPSQRNVECVLAA